MTKSKKQPPAFFAALGRFFRSKPMRVVGAILGTICKILLTILLIGMITACIAGVVLTVYVFNTYANAQEVPDITNIMNKGTSIVYTQTKDGDWVESQRLEGINRIWTDLPDIPEDLQNAIIAIEDERFYQHKGVDWRRTTAAVFNKFLGSGDMFGGSTITQQLIKVVSEDNDVTIERKIREIFRAIEMERDYHTKEEILEAYLNILPLSDNVVGVGAAANYYFGKEVEDLSLAESALIAGITNLPSYYDPYDHPAHALDRQKIILDKMYELKMITADEYRQAYGEELYFKNNARYVEVQDYYVDLLIEDIIADLQETYGYNYTYAEQLVFFGGLRIYSYENPKTQNAIESIFRDANNFPDVAGAEVQPNAAIFIMDYDGRVIATVGGRGEKTGNRMQNISTQSRRQPGSAIKPLGVFAPAIDLDIINYSTIVRDAPIKYNGELWPHNFGSAAKDNGWRTVQYALQVSLNTVPVRILEEMGVDASYEFLTEKLHFKSLVEEDKSYAPLALGGFTYGVTVREMTAGYQIFGNSGYYNKPTTYQKVMFDDQVLLEHVVANEPAISPESATIMNKLLQKVVTSGTGSSIRGSWYGTEVFAKTGTSTSNKDSYFVGGTPHYVAGVWMGYDQEKTLSEYQRGFAKTLWNTCMLKVHEGKEGASFDLWGDVEGHYYNPGSGICTGYSTGAYGYYKSGNVPYGVNSLGGVSYGGKPETTTETTNESTTTTGEGGTTTTAVGGTTNPSGGEGSTTAPNGGGETTLPNGGGETTAPIGGDTTPPTTPPTDPPTTPPTQPPTEPITPPTTPPTVAPIQEPDPVVVSETEDPV